MTKEELTYDSRDNATKIKAYKYLPEQVKPTMIVQIIHGMAETAVRYEEFAKFLTDKGCVVVINEHLGHGGSVKEGTPYGYFCEQDPATVVVRDVHRLKKNIQNQYPGIPYVIFGHSMGSYTLRNYITVYGSGIQAAVICAPGYQEKGLLSAMGFLVKLQSIFLGGKHVAKLLDKMAFGSYNKRIPNQRTAFDWLTRDEKIVDAYVADEKCGFTFTVNGFRTLHDLCLRSIDFEKMKKIPSDLPIMIIAGKEDPVGEYGAAVPKIQRDLENAGVKNVSVKYYEECRHELLNELVKETVMEDVYSYIEKQVK